MADDEVTGNDPTPSSSTIVAPQGEPTAGATATPATPTTATPADTSARMHAALKELNAGKSVADASRAYNAPKGAGQAGGHAPAAPATAGTASQTANPQPPASGGEANPANRGLTDAELNALKRGKVDITEAHWASVPASNLKAIAKNMAASQAEADRQYQLAKKGQAPTGEQQQQQAPAAPAAGDGQQQGNQPPAGSETTPATGQEDGTRQINGTSDFFQALPPLPQATVQTLTDIGGEELASGMQTVAQHVAQHMQQQMAPLIRGYNALAGMLEAADLRAGMAELRTQPGFEKLDDAQQAAIKEKATHLLRASSQPLDAYSMRDAVAEAARVLYSTNAQQQAQAQLLQRRSASLNGSPDKGTQRTTPSKPMNTAELARAVMETANREGITFAEARAKLEANGS